MKKILYLAVPAFLLANCGSGNRDYTDSKESFEDECKAEAESSDSDRDIEYDNIQSEKENNKFDELFSEYETSAINFLAATDKVQWNDAAWDEIDIYESKCDDLEVKLRNLKEFFTPSQLSQYERAKKIHDKALGNIAG